MRHLLGCLLLLTASVGALAGSSAGLTDRQLEQISQAAADALGTKHLPGLVVAVAKGGSLWSGGSGKADLEQDVPVTPQSLFRMASIGKWLTATAAMRLVDGEKPATEAERAALDELIRRERTTQYTRYTDVIAPLDTFKNDPLLFQPGTRVLYSSLGYRVLGCVLQGAAHTPYRELMRALVFEPAGMRSVIEDDALAVIPHRVAGYSRGPDGRIERAEFRDVSENLAAGGYLSTAEDLVRFAMAFRSGKLVSAAMRDRMLEHPERRLGIAILLSQG